MTLNSRVRNATDEWGGLKTKKQTLSRNPSIKPVTKNMESESHLY